MKVNILKMLLMLEEELVNVEAFQQAGVEHYLLVLISMCLSAMRAEVEHAPSLPSALNIFLKL